MTNTETAPKNDMPLFYSKIEPVSPELHKNFKLRSEADFSYAAKTNTVPLTLPEFTLVARHYPILFIGEELHPVAALGFGITQNLFVDDKGQWETGAYIPAYVRRFPFILLGGSDDGGLTLGVEGTANSTADNGRALFNADASPTDAINQALDFCDQFNNAHAYTRDFCEALKKTDIVEDRSVTVELKAGEQTNLGSFKRINEEKFKALPDATILEWHKKGFLHAVCFHLQSLNNWDILLVKNGTPGSGLPQA